MAKMPDRWYVQQQTQRFERATRAAVLDSALMVEATAKELIASPKSGRVYRKPFTKAETYIASAADEPPASRTGTMLRNIGHKIKNEHGKFVGEVGFIGAKSRKVPYAAHVLLGHIGPGGVYVAPRPLLRPALHMNEKNIRNRLAQIT